MSALSADFWIPSSVASDQEKVMKDNNSSHFIHEEREFFWMDLLWAKCLTVLPVSS